jgi:hypothetical protein
LNFLTLEAGTDSFSQNVSAELPLSVVWYLRTAQIAHYDLVMEALVWLCVVQFREIWLGIHFGTSYVTQDYLTYLSIKLKDKTVSCIHIYMVVCQGTDWNTLVQDVVGVNNVINMSPTKERISRSLIM